jgi:hypothetical protein
LISWDFGQCGSYDLRKKDKKRFRIAYLFLEQGFPIVPLSPHVFLALESLPDGVSEVVERHQVNSQHIYFRSKLEVKKYINILLI